jgi:hypothetical protein
MVGIARRMGEAALAVPAALAALAICAAALVVTLLCGPARARRA